MSDRYVSTNGIRLHYLEHPGNGPVLVLAPGLTANAHSFDGLMRAGLGDVAHVLALDLRGRGESDAPPSGYSMEDHARDVLGLLDALELERVVMGGHSFGGLLTYWLAANHPERVERCVVLDAPAVVNARVVEQIQPSLARLGQVYASWEEYLALVRSMPYFDEGGWNPDIESYFRADVRFLPDGTVRARSQPEHMGEAAAGTAAVDWAGLVSRIMQPTLLLRAPGSFGPPGSPPLLSRGDAEWTVGLIADGRLVDGIGNHLTFVFGQGAQVLTGAIAEFLVGVRS
jgi:pimeloyl-ACP methyl ester carboxylesterase